MASSDMKPAKFKKLLDAFVLLEPVRGAAERSRVTNVTAERFYRLLMDRMMLVGLLDMTQEVPEHVWQGEHLNEWVEEKLRAHRGFDDDETRAMHYVRYVWIYLMVHIHKPMLTSYEGSEALRLFLNAVKKPLIEMIKTTGPLNREPSPITINRAREKFYRDMKRRLENRKNA